MDNYTSYIGKDGVEIFVSDGISQGDQWGTFTCKPSGSLKRLKSSEMPMVDSRKEAQANLDSWAEKKGLRVVDG
ncbi:MAG: hypothetical protein ACYC1U_06725 [Candidatus Aquicultorales bacterium]